MKTVILAGGLGTRLSEETSIKPKPMVEIGGLPMLWHIMRLYAAHSFDEFVVALGYKGEVIKDYFLRYHQMRSSLTVDLGRNQVDVHAPQVENWRVHLVDTGPRTETGGRLRRLAPWLGKERFFMTYGDGLSDVDLHELLAFHRRHGRLATLTAVRPPARFGALHLEEDVVASFREKPESGGALVNGGFFVLEPEVLDYIDGDDVSFEGAPLERLARDGQLMAHRHGSFWHCMDTLRDVHVLNRLWDSGAPPWIMERRRTTDSVR